MTERASGPSPVFLVGAQRSGTTALGHALSRAFAAAGGRFTVNGKLPYLLRRWLWQDDLRCQHLRADEVEHGLRRIPAGGVDAGAWLDRASDALRAAAARAADREAAGVIEDEVRRICDEAYGGVMWGDKYNEYLLDLPWLDRVLPGARWIFIVREPADVVASMLSWSREKVWNPGDAGAAAAKWSAWNDLWLRFRDSVEPGRRFETGYDQLAGDGGRRLSDWLGLDVAAELGDFRAKRRAEVGGDLPREALETRRAFAELGLLGGGGAPDEEGSSHTLRQEPDGDAAPTHLHHVLLAMPPGEEQVARDFYGRLLGLPEIRKPPVLAARGGVWFRAGELEVHLGIEEDFRPARVAHPGFGARGLDRLATRLETNDVPVRWDSNYPGHRRFYVNDPFGNRLEFLERA